MRSIVAAVSKRDAQCRRHAFKRDAKHCRYEIPRPSPPSATPHQSVILRGIAALERNGNRLQ